MSNDTKDKPEDERRKGERRTAGSDRRGENRVETEDTPRRQNPDRRKDQD